MINNLPESLVIETWQDLLLNGTELVTEGGEPIRVIYPGRINDDRGGDFRDAVIAVCGRLIKGDIEVHVKSSTWLAHQHHYDPAYNQVILHVVMWHDTKTATNLQNGGNVPIVELHKYLKGPISHSPPLSMPCLEASKHLWSDVIAEFLDSAGEERFLAKVAKFKADLAQMEASQSLYQGIMSALGYSKNKIPFLELARRLPLQTLESITRGKISDEGCLVRQQALLLGTAGLLPSQRQDGHHENKSDDKWADKLEKLWAYFNQTEAMSPDAWHLFKVRPNNSPIRRIAAMSYLLIRYREKGIFEEIVNMVRGVPLSQGNYRLEKGLMVTTNGYWASHFDFGSGGGIRNPALLGDRRAADIVVNVLLPFTFAWSQLTSQPELGRKAFDLYRHHPRLAANTIEGHMKAQLELGNSLVNSALRQQGLLHIYNTLCTQGRCNCCSLSQLKAGHYIQI